VEKVIFLFTTVFRLPLRSTQLHIHWILTKNKKYAMENICSILVVITEEVIELAEHIEYRRGYRNGKKP
jgi:hypothetical protein